MRHNKFRVWCKDLNEWEQDLACILPDGTVATQNHRATTFRVVDSETHIPSFAIGLQDTEGTDIYEGDIVLGEVGTCGYGMPSAKYRDCLFVVEYYLEDARYRLVKLSDVPLSYYVYPSWSMLKVVGDRFANPEMMEERV